MDARIVERLAIRRGPLDAIAAVLRSGARVRRLHRVRAVLLAVLTVGVLGALLADRLLLALYGLLLFVLVDTTCKAIEGLLRVAPEHLAALRSWRPVAPAAAGSPLTSSASASCSVEGR